MSPEDSSSLPESLGENGEAIILVNAPNEDTQEEAAGEGGDPKKRAKRRRKKKAGPRKPLLPPIVHKLWQIKPLRRVSLLALGAGAVVGGLAIARSIAVRQLPDPGLALTYERRGTLTIKSSDGEILQKLGPSTQEPMRLVQIPQKVVDAFIAAEDRRFEQHEGVDYWSIARAIFANITARDVVEGGSTITQQVARIAFLDQDQTITRKLKEALLAQEIETKLTKKQILERYLNLVYLGSGAYGVADAAWIYFGKPIQQLTLAEAATIAGLPPAPSLYSPLVNPEFAKERRGVVLARMVESGSITQAEANQANQEPLKVKPQQPKYLNSRSPYFTTFVQKELTKYLTKDQIEAGGLTVDTTLNYQWQDHAESVLVNVVLNEGYYEGFDQAAVTVIDPRSGEIRVMVGGADFGKSQFNRVTQAQRQPGSTFKTLVYATGIAAGFSPYDTYQDAPFIVDGYQPKNFGNTYSGGVNIARALTKSINVVAIKTLIDVGFNPVIRMARNMGIESKLEPTYSMALGSWEVNLLELTGAYGSLANDGKHIPPHGITRVTARDGKVLFDAAKRYKPKQAIDANSAAITTWMLEGVVTEGTGAPASLGDRSVAGKTGTSEKARDLWFIGYIPQYVAGVWLGNDDDYPTAGSSGTAAMLWKLVMRRVTEGLAVQDFAKFQLDDRKGSIKAEPVKPRYTANPAPPPPPESAYQGSNNSGYSDGGGQSSDSGYYEGGGDSGGGDSESSGGGYYEGESGGGYQEPAPAEQNWQGGDNYAEPAYEAAPAPPPEPAYVEPEPPPPPPEPAYEEAPPPPPEPPL